jgi:hypothetical protein
MGLGGNAVVDRVLTELLRGMGPSDLLKLTPSQNDELKSGAKVLGGSRFWLPESTKLFEQRSWKYLEALLLRPLRT